MAKNNSSNQDYTNNSDGWDLSGGTTKRKLTITGGDMTLTGSGANTYTFPASTDTLVGRASSDTLTNKDLTSSTNVLPTTTLGYAQITSDFTSTTTGSYTDVTSLSVTVTVPSGGRRVKITAGGYYMNTTAGAGTNVELVCYDNTAAAIIGGTLQNNFGAFYAMLPAFVTSHVPASGSRTYKLQFKTNVAGTFTLKASASIPAFILVELI